MLVLCLLGVGSIFAQSTIKGDMNGDGKLTVADVTELVATINGKKGIEYLSLSDPYATDNTGLVGTWYLTKTSSITFNADGTTDYFDNSKYDFRPNLGFLNIYDNNGTPLKSLNVTALNSNFIVLQDGMFVTKYTSAQPVQLVTELTLNKTYLKIEPSSCAMLEAFVLPDYADNKKLEWTSSDPGVATVDENGNVLANAEGSVTITCHTTDGSDLYAYCAIDIVEKPGPNGHDYVDLGLVDKENNPIYWATCNIGADEPHRNGYYFAWGETEPKDRYEDDYSNYYDNTFEKYNYDNCILVPSDDAAQQNWGGAWRMPTSYELGQLTDECEWTWTSNYNSTGKAGYIVSGTKPGYTDKHIFLPAAGYRVNGATYYVTPLCYYWSSSTKRGTGTAQALFMGDDYDDNEPFYCLREQRRYLGFPVRAVFQY